MKTAVWAGILIGGTVGGSVPMLWRNYDYISPTYGFFAMIGSGVGVVFALKAHDFLTEEDEKEE